MLAGRRLLLADDSITIQKVVALTFADEGVEVVTANDGQEAIEKLNESPPDIVLADAFMPVLNGYEVCERIKQDPKLKHIPVMLLVGSFEPFDESEARRVGADEILTKPFQSIRRLIDKVGGLVSGKSTEEEVPTAELPPVEEQPAAPEQLTSEELEITTADTQQLPAVEQIPEVAAYQASLQKGTDNNRDYQTMDTPSRAWQRDTSVESDTLLDLGDLGRSVDVAEEDFVLDIDLTEDDAVPAVSAEPVPAASARPVVVAESLSQPRSFVEPSVSGPSSVNWDVKVTTDFNEDQFAETQEWPRPQPEVIDYSRAQDQETRYERVVDDYEPLQQPATPTGQIGIDQLSPETIDAIARRAVEHLSEKVIQEIAWEVVPQLAELLIKRKLEEKEPKPN